MSQFHVSQIETHVRELHEDGNWIPSLTDENNLSRLLALRALDIVLGVGDGDGRRIIEITDGGSDRGIDAIGVDPPALRVTFVQSKWRRDGSGSMSLEGMLKFLDGVRSLLGMHTQDEPTHAGETTRQAVHDLLRTPGARIQLVTATTASNPLSAAVMQPIKELLQQLNDLEDTEPIATHTHLAQADFFNAISEEVRPAVDIDVQMLDWGKSSEPLKVFYGRVSAAEIAGWHSAHGDDLYAENIRVVIPKSEINEGIRETVLNEPEKFLYYNNGITVIAGQIEVSPGGLLNRDVLYARLSSASVVNGAQTASTLGSILTSEFKGNLGQAYVLVRCIEVPPDDKLLGRTITQFANTQNDVSSQDFAFLDQEQHRLVKELRVLGYEYILRSAEVPKSSEPSRVINVRQAAIALACSSGLSYALIAKREVSRLFSEEAIYRALFNGTTDALKLLRAVRVLRVVDDVLSYIEAESEGVTAGVAVHGGRVITYIVMRDLGEAFFTNPAVDVEDVLAGLEEIVYGHVDSLVDVFPDNAYPGNLFKNQLRSVGLLRDANLES